MKPSFSFRNWKIKFQNSRKLGILHYCTNLFLYSFSSSFLCSLEWKKRKNKLVQLIMLARFWNISFFFYSLFYVDTSFLFTKHLKSVSLKAGLYDETFLSRPWNFYFKRSVEIFQEAKCVSWNIIQFVHTIKLYSYDPDNVSFIERISNFHFSCQRYCSFKCLKILKKHS